MSTQTLEVQTFDSELRRCNFTKVGVPLLSYLISYLAFTCEAVKHCLIIIRQWFWILETKSDIICLQRGKEDAFKNQIINVIIQNLWLWIFRRSMSQFFEYVEMRKLFACILFTLPQLSWYFTKYLYENGNKYLVIGIYSIQLNVIFPLFLMSISFSTVKSLLLVVVINDNYYF